MSSAQFEAEVECKINLLKNHSDKIQAVSKGSSITHEWPNQWKKKMSLLIALSMFLSIFLLPKVSYAGLFKTNSAWPNSTIPIEIDQKFSIEETNIIIQSLNNMMNVTNLYFKKHNPAVIENFIRYTKYEVINEILDIGGNSNAIGMLGLGGQDINLSTVHPRTVVHETMHALGFYHEQSRNDNSKFITINWTNIEIPYILNFAPMDLAGAKNIGSYDIRSIMHYPYNAFGKIENGRRVQTIVNNTDQTDTTFGKSVVMSTGDIASINAVYTFRPRNRPQLAELKTMNIGERKTLTIEANKELNFFGLPVVSGQRYRFNCYSRDRWKGQFNGESISAAGISKRTCRRFSANKYMKMTGSVYQVENTSGYTQNDISIGIGYTEYSIPSGVTGFFTFFANDCPGNYFDNQGSIRIVIERIQ